MNVDLFIFFISALLILGLLSWYYGKMSNKSSVLSLSSESSIFYDLRDVLLQEKSNIKDYHLVNENKSVILQWNFLKEGNEFIKGFELNKSNKADGIYKTILKNIPAKSRKVQYDNLDATNYFTITAIGKEGNSRTSYPVLVQPRFHPASKTYRIRR